MPLLNMKITRILLRISKLKMTLFLVLIMLIIFLLEDSLITKYSILMKKNMRTFSNYLKRKSKKIQFLVIRGRTLRMKMIIKSLHILILLGLLKKHSTLIIRIRLLRNLKDTQLFGYYSLLE